MGTAGHIDHGKTSLIRALTGTDCDRLDEEKRRGITIELGFAELALPSGRTISVVDVPGHERFVRAMVSGASGIDFVLLVVAADEGVMPQTREHLEICGLLGIDKGIVALTKADAVDADMLALAEGDVRDCLAGTLLADAPLLAVSSVTGQGLDVLVKALADLESTLAPRRSRDMTRLPVDRVFTMRGHGTVLTGTLVAGSLAVGQSVCLYPKGLESNIRALQSHGGSVERAPAGRRTAVNVPDIAVDQVERGDVLSLPGMLFLSSRWALRLTCLPSSPRPLRHRAEVHFHHGSRAMQARLYFADRDKLQPGESCLCEARFSGPATGVFGDRCVARSFSPLRTVGGALLLNPLGVDMRRRSQGFAERCALLASLPDAAPEERVLAQLLCTEGAGKGLSFARLRVLTNLDGTALEKSLSALSSRAQVVCLDKDDKLYLAESLVETGAAACRAAVEDFHVRYPEKQGMRRGELLSGWGRNMPPKLANFIIERLLKRNVLTRAGEYLRLTGHSAAFGKDQAPLGEALLAAYKEAGLAPPNTGDLLTRLGVSKKEAAPVLAALRASGDLIRVTEGVWYDAAHLKEAERLVRVWFETHDSIDLAGLKSLTGLSRKYLVALLEYFDAARVTMRIGDVRRLRH
jgi:selenocysteine-specific elongation factor